MDIRSTWQSFFGEQVPVSYLLRKQNKDIWFRIHSLPESKRYAENEEEMQEILRRHNTVAAEVLTQEGECALFFSEYDLREHSSAFSEVSAKAAFFCHYEDEDRKITQWGAKTEWVPHKFDPILRLVANWQSAHVSWMNLQTGELFAPYDGGADLFLSSTQRRDELRTRYSAWLSPYPTGF